MLLNEYINVRRQTERLCEPLQIEDFIPQAVEFASPPKWHLAHVTWFFETFILKNYVNDYTVFDERFDFLFNSYYQSVGERLPRTNRGLITRPSVQEVYDYRKYVDKFMQKVLSDTDNNSLKNLVELGINHEQQHQELLITDLKYVFSLNPIYPVYKKDSTLEQTQANSSEWIKIEEGLYRIGYDQDGFCYDNELGPHKVYLPAFEIASSCVSNAEYKEFIKDGGYKNFKYWLDDGWSWLCENNITHPLYWVNENNTWHHFTLSGLEPVDDEQVVTHLSYYEANAFATWKGLRLPTEFEWEVSADQINWGQCWEWTTSAYHPYPNFQIGDGAVGEYNGKFMVNQMVLRGSSVATAKKHSRKTYRNFFAPQMQWQYSGIRLVKK